MVLLSDEIQLCYRLSYITRCFCHFFFGDQQQECYDALVASHTWAEGILWSFF